jgi:hypothetical protein
MNNLLTAIMTKITTGPSAFSIDVGGRVYLDEAPAGTEFPYCVFFIVSGVPEWQFVERFEDTLIQFSLFSSSQGATEITTMYTDLKALFDDCSMTITGDTLIWFRRENLTTMVDEITTADGMQTVKHWAVDYEAKVQT